MAFPSEKIASFIRAEYPLIYLVSWEEERVEESLRLLSKESFRDDYNVYSWSCTNGFSGENGESEGINDALSALKKVQETNEKGFFLFKDLHFFLKDPKIIRELKDLHQTLKSSSKTLFIVSPSVVLPAELEREMTIFEIGLPDSDDARIIFDEVTSPLKDKSHQNHYTPEFREKCVHALQGLASSEMKFALKRILLDGEERSEEEIVTSLMDEKALLINRIGTLEYIRGRVGLDDIGGLENLKEWLKTRALAFAPDARQYGLDMPKGLLIMGISGCGKSLCAKAVASVWNLPLLRLDLNQLYSGIFGTPEEAFRNTIKTVETISPCVLWIDEIEAGITRSGEKTSDSPASRIFGSFLTWMQEKKYPVFIAATANQIDLLPPEILRKGRFDEIFFVSLPSKKARKEIFRIHLVNRHKDPDSFDIDSLAKNTEGLSGSEIEQVVVSALFEAYSKQKELDERELIIAASSIVPLSTTMREEISRLERWASDRAVAASK
ncbi:MAG TPA: AAA family ATPase [Thermodesulfobacteriota bacterium]